MLLGILLWMPVSVFADQHDDQQTWGESTPYHQFERFFIAGQPDLPALEQARGSGVSIVINLRGPAESDWDEENAVESIGLEYHQVAVNGAASPLAASPFDAISAIVDANPDARILLHCASGNRAAAWLAVYLAEVEGLDTDEAIKTARENGLTNAGLEAKVKTLLER